jgi:hypothetical protein
LIMLAGECMITIDNGKQRVVVQLNRPDMAIYAPPMLWIELDAFSPGAICAVLTSGDYDPEDYIRERSEFVSLSS